MLLCGRTTVDCLRNETISASVHHLALQNSNFTLTCVRERMGRNILFVSPKFHMTYLSLPLQPSVQTPHYWPGHLPIAFVFSVPGSHEKFASRPVVGATGENLSIALEYLHIELPSIFSSADRYAYRITNAYSKPIAKSLGNRSSQASHSQVKTTENIARALRDLDGCNLVILCGLKAQLLAESIRQPGRKVVCTWHTSNQALANKFRSIEVSKFSESSARRQLRSKLWAQYLLNSLHSSDPAVYTAL